MPELRKRKPTASDNNANATSSTPSSSTKSKDNTKSTAKKQSSPKSRSLFSICFQLTYILLGLFFGASYIITSTWTWGYKLPNWRKYLPREELILSAAQLAEFDGSDPTKPIYLAVNGLVFDVTEGRSHYGPGGGYAFFSGKDAARAYITGCFQTHLTHDLRGLSEKQLKDLDSWTKFYQDHSQYFYVGKVVHPEIDPNSPIPEDCHKKAASKDGNDKKDGAATKKSKSDKGEKKPKNQKKQKPDLGK